MRWLFTIFMIISALPGFAQNTEGILTDIACDVCHQSGDWSKNAGANFDHISTGFELKGIHRDIDCSACHLGSTTIEKHDFTQAVGECSRCHVDVHRDQWGQACERCHNSESWELPIQDQNHDLTRFPLLGAHQNQPCESCHISNPGNSVLLPLDCWGCHDADYRSTQDPDHVMNGFPRSCDVCHSPVNWASDVVDHDKTRFPLRGAHKDIGCESCHSVGYNIETSCESCHQTTYANTSEPDHGLTGYPENLCESCHSQSAWQPAIFTHNVSSVSCANCHSLDYSSSTQPPHELMSFSNSCTECHTTETWIPSTYEHSDLNTGFLLKEAHTDVACIECHSVWNVTTEPRTCYDANCHLTDYQETTEPNHVQNGFPGSSCESCHTEIAWKPAIFSHNIPSIACVTCHLANFTSTTQPPHALVSFSQTCEDCHSTTAWAPSLFLHDEQNTGFMLEGAHTSTNCQLCHAVWQINAEPRSCADASCHLPDYQGTTNPDHEAASFPLECEGCHTMNAWTPATFDHDGQNFPIYSGQHRNEWNDCSQCHINPADYKAFTCFGGGCHNISEMNSEHCEGSNCESCNGITYPRSGVTSDNCLTCHPTGSKHDCGDSSLEFYPPRRFRPMESDSK